MTNREQLIQEIQHAPEAVVSELLSFLETIKASQQIQQATEDAATDSIETLQKQIPGTPEERLKRWHDWVSSMPQNSPGLPEEAMHRDAMYDE